METIRPAGPRDLPALRTLYAAAFPDEDLVPLASALLAEAGVLTLVAAGADGLCGTICLTPCTVAGAPVALLGPLGVAPLHQRRGLGRALIARGVAGMRARGAVQVNVLGDPAYYGRMGFVRDPDVAPPYPIPEDWAPAWQRLGLEQGTAGPPAGPLQVPRPWRDPSFWMP